MLSVEFFDHFARVLVLGKHVDSSSVKLIYVARLGGFIMQQALNFATSNGIYDRSPCCIYEETNTSGRREIPIKIRQAYCGNNFFNPPPKEVLKVNIDGAFLMEQNSSRWDGLH